MFSFAADNHHGAALQASEYLPPCQAGEMDQVKSADLAEEAADDENPWGASCEESGSLQALTQHIAAQLVEGNVDADFDIEDDNDDGFESQLDQETTLVGD